MCFPITETHRASLKFRGLQPRQPVRSRCTFSNPPPVFAMPVVSAVGTYNARPRRQPSPAAWTDVRFCAVAVCVAHSPCAPSLLAPSPCASSPPWSLFLLIVRALHVCVCVFGVFCACACACACARCRRSVRCLLPSVCRRRGRVPGDGRLLLHRLLLPSDAHVLCDGTHALLALGLYTVRSLFSASRMCPCRNFACHPAPHRPWCCEWRPRPHTPRVLAAVPR